MSETKRRAIIVLGMHRSGTSALTGVLGLLGARLPTRLMPVRPDNPKGHFEPENIVAIHDRILASVGTSWSSWEEIPEAWFLSKPSRAFVDELVEAISEDYGAAALFVVKDPRMCRLMPLWYSVLDRIDVKPCFAIPLRNPVEVAKSIQILHKLSLPHGCLLWLRHVLDAEHHTRGHPRVFLHYRDLLAEPRSVIDRMRTGLGVAWPRQVKSSLGEIEDFLDPSLRHQIAHEGEIDDMGDFSPWLRQAYECYEALVHSPTDRAAKRRLDSLHAAFAAADAAFTPVLKQQAKQHSTELAAFGEMLAARQTELTTLGRALAERDKQVTALGNTLGERDTRLTALDQTLAEREAKVAVLDQALDESEAKVAALDQTLSDREAKLAALDQALAESEAKVTALDQALDESEAKVAALDHVLDERDRKLDGLQDALAERDANVAALQSTISALRASTSWYITAPLRWTKRLLQRMRHSAAVYPLKLAWRLLRTRSLAPLHEWRELRRSKVLTITPQHDLKIGVQGADSWTSTGRDPSFDLTASRGRLPTKWTRVRMQLDVTGLLRLSPTIYVNSGRGYSEEGRVDLPEPVDGRIDYIVYLPNKVVGMRFDPMDRPGQFKLGAIEMRQIGKLEAGLRLAIRILSVAHPRDIVASINTARRIYASGAFSLMKVHLVEALRPPHASEYERWLSMYDELSVHDRETIRQRIEALEVRPKISIIMPVYNIDRRWLRAAIESVRSQLYPDWELCISDDASTLAGIQRELRKFSAQDRRIRVHFRETNGNISANSNDALSLASGDFIALMDADDTLSEDALYWIAEEINAHPRADLIFSDEDKIDIDGKRFDAYFKPNWNPALMLSQNFFSHLGVYRRSLVEKVGGFRLGFEGSQDHDLVLRCSCETTSERICHIPRVLYHWRAIETSTAAGGGVKPYAWDAGQRAIEEHLAQKNIHAKVGHAPLANYYYQVEYAVPRPRPRVSILIPTTAKPELIKPCLDSVLKLTTYDNFEVLVLVGETQQAMPDRAAYLSWASHQPRVRMLAYPDRPFNFSWVNNWGAGHATGDILCLLNDDTEIITPDWLEKLVARVSLNGVGAVGPMMYYPDDTIQHAGVVLGLEGIAGHVFRGAPRGSTDYFGRACLEQDLSCVTAGCMVVRKEAYLGIGGMDEAFAIAFNDVDFCIRLRAAGWRIIWTPVVELYHHESVSIGKHDALAREPQFLMEIDMMRKLWGPVLDFDPYYNVNLSLSEPFSLAFPPRQTDRAEMAALEGDGTTF